jgi:adenine-specific DNA-methyltransferase
MFVNGSAEILPRDYKSLKDSSKPCFIIDLNNVPESSFSSGLKKYLALGVEQKIQERYKCSRRRRWYDIPSIWKSEGLFFKRGHHYPKLIVNKADVYVTDSAYRVRMNEGYDIQSFASSFYNSLTLLHAELNGRYYGGGVLEITPNEFKRLPLPYSQVSNIEYKTFTSNFKRKTSIENFLEEHDKSTLGEVYGLPEENIKLIQSLYKKVKNRRLKGRYT